MNTLAVILLILIVLAFGGGWRLGGSYMYGGNVIGVILICILILALMGKI